MEKITTGIFVKEKYVGKKSSVQTTQGLKILALENKLRVQVKYNSWRHYKKWKTFKELEIINLKQNHQQNLAGISQVSDWEKSVLKNKTNPAAGIVQASVQFDQQRKSVR